MHHCSPPSLYPTGFLEANVPPLVAPPLRLSRPLLPCNVDTVAGVVFVTSPSVSPLSIAHMCVCACVCACIAIDVGMRSQSEVIYITGLPWARAEEVSEKSRKIFPKSCFRTVRRFSRRYVGTVDRVHTRALHLTSNGMFVFPWRNRISTPSNSQRVCKVPVNVTWRYQTSAWSPLNGRHFS